MKPSAPTPKRVLMTVDSGNGTWNYALELTQALLRQNVQVALAILGGKLSREQRREVKPLTDLEIFESAFEWTDAEKNDLDRVGPWLLEIEKRTSPDVVHLNNHAHAVLPFQSPKVVVAHSCSVAGRSAHAEGLSAHYEGLAKGLQAADLIVAPTNATLIQLETRYGKLPGKVIFNGRDPAKFLAARKEEFILATGSLWDEAKNVDTLAAVASALPWTLYAAADGRSPNGKTLKYKMLQFLGKLPGDLLARWYGRASIYAFPARCERSGLCVLEAALAGCALVLGDSPSLREIWNGVAIFVPPNDPDELKNALSQLIFNPIRRKEFASYAQCRAIQLTPQTMARQYISAYGEVMEKRLSGVVSLALMRPASAAAVACS